ncbi:MAG: Maf family nucleotide pyrophosphatase [Gammaproteobacteria bacterium]|nr:Maf family nucleotide pyrophosphatase [Gammaproteobacteria bacterium]
MKLILGSTSPFRKELLERLQIEFSCASPDVDETPIEGESIEAMVMRLSELKAEAVAEQIKGQDALIIGSDQSAVLNGKPLTKPGNFNNAVKQLTEASGQRIVFQTGLCLLNTRTGKKQTICEPYTVIFKKLSAQKIENYLKKEEPYNCAGSFKSEGLGIALFEKFEGEDPNSLIGLPLIKLVGMLENVGLEIPSS